MMISMAVIAWAVAANAAELVTMPAFDVGVHPALVPALSEPGSPTLGLLENRAQILLERASAGQAAQYLAELSSPKAPEADRLAAGALARLIVEPGLASSVAPLSPALAHLSEALTPGGPYRGAPSDRSPFIQLALSARRDPAVTALFDGGGAPALELSEAGMDGSRLRLSGKKAGRLRKNGDSDTFAHAGIDGVAVEVYHEPLAIDEKSSAIEESELKVQRLARAGAGPRLLGADVIFSKGLGPEPMRVVSLRERIDGKTASELARQGYVDDADRSAVAKAVEAAASAGYDVSGLSFDAVVIGQTALKGIRRSAIVDPSGLKPQPVPGWAAKAAKDWMKRFDEAVFEARRATRMEGMLLR